MHTPLFLLSLMATVSALETLHYKFPSSFKAAADGCTLPSEFVVINFTTYTDKHNASLNTVSLGFGDPDTNIKTTCRRNSTSLASGPSKNKYGCENANVAFIYQTTGVAGLTLVERACPGTT
jgi:hypothetical protein